MVITVLAIKTGYLSGVWPFRWLTEEVISELSSDRAALKGKAPPSWVLKPTILKIIVENTSYVLEKNCWDPIWWTRRIFVREICESSLIHHSHWPDKTRQYRPLPTAHLYGTRINFLLNSLTAGEWLIAVVLTQNWTLVNGDLSGDEFVYVGPGCHCHYLWSIWQCFAPTAPVLVLNP